MLILEGNASARDIDSCLHIIHKKANLNFFLEENREAKPLCSNFAHHIGRHDARGLRRKTN
jgi:hypothetical protein